MQAQLFSKERLAQQLSTGTFLSFQPAAANSIGPPQGTASFRKHRESVLRLLDLQDQWDAACPFFAFKLTLDDSTGAWVVSAKEAAVSFESLKKRIKHTQGKKHVTKICFQKSVTTVLSPGLDPLLYPFLPLSHNFFFFSVFFEFGEKNEEKKENIEIWKKGI